MAESDAPQPAPVPKRKKSRAWLYILGGCLLVAGLGTAGYLKNKGRARATEVMAAEAVVKTITELVTASGKIQPEVEVKIAPEVAGEIVELPFREGAQVSRGDLLARIKSDNYQFQVEQREADLAAARAGSLQAKVRMLKAEEDLGRAEEVFKQRLISESELATTRADRDAAKAAYANSLAQIRRAEGLLKQAQDQLEKTTIYSPIDGTISSLSTEVGERVAGTGQYGGAEIMRVADLENMEVRVSVNENDIVNVKIGDHARIEIDAYPDETFHGTVTEIASTAQTLGRNTQEEVTNFEVRIRIADAEVNLRPGMSATADIETQTAENVVAVPIQSVTVRSREGAKTVEQLEKDRNKKAAENKGEGAATAVDERRQRELEKADRESLQRVVFKIVDDEVKMIPVETGIADTTHMEIKSGIEPGDRVVSGPFSTIARKLKDGMKIRIRKPSKKDDEDKDA